MGSIMTLCIERPLKLGFRLFLLPPLMNGIRSQIEPAVPYTSSEFTYLDYENREPDYYLTRTAYWVGKFRESKQ